MPMSDDMVRPGTTSSAPDSTYTRSSMERGAVGISHDVPVNDASAVDASETDTSEVDSRMAMALLAAHEQERSRLAEELHDGPAQALANAIFQTEIVDRAVRDDPAAARTEIQALRQMLERELDTLRGYINQLPPEQTGWLAGTRDPEVGRALTMMHRSPSRPWTIASLAHEVGMSRSVLAERFRHYLGDTPMAYLTRWRLRLGAQLLQTTSHSVAQVALEVGYESEAAFNRAFKRATGAPPATWRKGATSMS